MKTTRLVTSTFLTASALALGFMAQSAQAVILVSDANNGRDCQTSEVKLSGTEPSIPVNSGNADACAGYFGFPAGGYTAEVAQINLYTIDQIGDPGVITGGEDLWQFAYKSDGGAANNGDPVQFLGIGFVVTYENTNPDGTGTWKVSWTDTTGAPNLPTYLDLAFGFKSSTEIAYYMFDDVYLTATTACTSPTADGCKSGAFDLLIDKDLSHESMFVRAGRIPQQRIPEPGVLFLMGAGLLGLGMARRRKSA